VAAVLVWQLDAGHPRYPLVILAATFGATAVATVLKRLLSRVRPGRENAGKFLGPSLKHANYKESFPSSHSASAVALSVTLATLYPAAAATFWGLALACAGLFLLGQVDAASGPPDIVWRLVLVGAGTGIFQSPNNRALMQAAPGREQGEASGVLGTGRVVGQSLSVALAGAVFAALGGTYANAQLAAWAEGQPLPAEQVAQFQQAFVTAFHAALVVCGCVAAAGGSPPWCDRTASGPGRGTSSTLELAPTSSSVNKMSKTRKY
jgi:hypothetical protein